jgi:hypothetical protein
MEKLRRVMVWCALALGVTVLLLFALPSYRQGEASIAGKTADDFALEMDGKAQHLSVRHTACLNPPRPAASPTKIIIG